MPVDVGGGDLRVGEDVGELCQGLGGVGADVGLAEVEEDAVLQGDEGAAGFDGLEGFDGRELAELGGLVDLRRVGDRLCR